MSGKPSKQLGDLLNRVPPATVTQQQAAAARLPAVSHAPGPATPASTPAGEAEEQEVPLQVLVPRHVRVQLDRMHADTRKPLRALTLEALRAIGIEVSSNRRTRFKKEKSFPKGKGQFQRPLKSYRKSRWNMEAKVYAL